VQDLAVQQAALGTVLEHVLAAPPAAKIVLMEVRSLISVVCVSIPCRFVPTRILRSCLKSKLGRNVPIQTIGLQVSNTLRKAHTALEAAGRQFPAAAAAAAAAPAAGSSMCLYTLVVLSICWCRHPLSRNPAGSVEPGTVSD
jgi:hypothetical protein